MSDRRLLIAIAATEPFDYPPLARLEADVDLLADQLAGRGLDVVRVAGGEATDMRVREVIADLEREAAVGGIADLLVLYVAGHALQTATGGLEVVLADGARLNVEELAAVLSAAQRSVLIIDTDQDTRAADALGQAVAAEAGSSGRSIALLWAPGTDLTSPSGVFAEALVAALARTGVVDSSFSGTLNERLAMVTGGQSAVLWSFGSPVVVPRTGGHPGYKQ